MLPTNPQLFSIFPPSMVADPVAHDSTPTLGATLLLAGARCLPDILDAARQIVTGAPWAPLCLVMDYATWRRFNDGTRIADGLSSDAISAIPANSLDPSTLNRVLGTVDANASVPGKALAKYAAGRIGCPACGRAVLEALHWDETPRSGLVARTLRRQLRRSTPFGRLEWTRLGALARLPRLGVGVDRLAGELGVTTVTLRRWVRRFLDMDARDFAVRPGWSWVLELALRRAGVSPPGAAATESVA